MSTSRPDVAHFEQKIMPEVRLQVEAELLRYGRTIPLIDDGDRPLGGRRVSGELWECKIRPERIGEAGRRIRPSDQLTHEREGWACRKLDKRLPGGPANVNTVSAAQDYPFKWPPG